MGMCTCSHTHTLRLLFLACLPACLLVTYPCAYPCCLQLIITHIPARRASIRRLLAAQGLLLRQPTPGGADWLDDSGAAPALLCACSGSSLPGGLLSEPAA